MKGEIFLEVVTIVSGEGIRAGTDRTAIVKLGKKI
jgi:hypothetical protein